MADTDLLMGQQHPIPVSEVMATDILGILFRFILIMSVV